MPAPPHSLHQPALHGERPANVICWLLFCYKACAGRIVRRLCLPAAALFCGLCLPAAPLPCHAHCPHRLPPVQFALPPVHSMCARIISLQAARTVLLAAATRACSGGPCAGSRFDFYLFPAELLDPGPWFSVNLSVKMYCTYKCAPPACLS